MSLRNGLQVVLQYFDGTDLVCRGFAGFLLPQPAQVAVLPTSPATEPTAQRLGRSLEAAIVALQPGCAVADMPCGGVVLDPRACHAWREAACGKVIFLVGDGATPLVAPRWAAPTARVIPVLPRGANIGALLQPPLASINAVTFAGDVIDVVPDLLSIIGLTAAERRVFISYRRRDAQALADQLFDALSHEGFDVFLDRFRVPPALDFQARLEQEIFDKGLIVVIESAGIEASPWVAWELDMARTHRLGLVGVHLPDGVALPQVRGSCRIEIKRSELKKRAPEQRLESIGVRRVVGAIKALHGKALGHRHRILHRAMSMALHLAGARDVQTSAGATLEAKPSSAASAKTYAVSLTPRSPELADFHGISLQAGAARGIVVGPCAFFEPARRERLDWLANKSAIAYRDESELLQLARDIAAGAI